MRTAQVDALASVVLSQMQRADVAAILLKGSTFDELYPERHRLYLDVDVLVGPRGMSIAGQVLRELGFRDTTEGMRPDELTHSTTWVRVGSPDVDLHWTLWGPASAPAEVWEALARHTEPHVVAGERFVRLNAPARALHLALHAIQSGSEHARGVDDLERGLWLLDSDAWRAAAELARELEADDPFVAGLLLCERGRHLVEALNLGRPLPRSLILRAQPASCAARSLAEWTETAGAAAKARWALRRAFPSVATIRQTEGCARYAVLVPAAYLSRLVRLAWRSGPALRAVIRAGSPGGDGLVKKN